MVYLLQIHNSRNHDKMSDKPKLKDIWQNSWPLLLREKGGKILDWDQEDTLIKYKMLFWIGIWNQKRKTGEI